MSYVLDHTIEPLHPRAAMLLKRLLDLVGAVLVLVMTAPLLAVMAGMIACTMGRPVIARRRCAGRDGYPFMLYTFRTVRSARKGKHAASTDDERLTWVGRLLHASHLHALPQCWNILKGEMSFVGPRPQLQEALSHYTAREALRSRVRPGVAGWAQLQASESVSRSRRLELDAWYVEHWSLGLDLRILLLTIPRLLRQ